MFPRYVVNQISLDERVITEQENQYTRYYFHYFEDRTLLGQTISMNQYNSMSILNVTKLSTTEAVTSSRQGLENVHESLLNLIRDLFAPS